MTLNIKFLTQIDKLTYSEPLTRTINLGLNPIQDGSFRGCSQKGGARGTKGPPFLESVTNILYLSINHVTHHLRSSDISIFLTEISKFCYIEKYRYRLYFDTLFLILLIFFESRNIFLINMVIILMMSKKMATLGVLKIKAF